MKRKERVKKMQRAMSVKKKVKGRILKRGKRGLTMFCESEIVGMMVWFDSEEVTLGYLFTVSKS